MFAWISQYCVWKARKLKMKSHQSYFFYERHQISVTIHLFKLFLKYKLATIFIERFFFWKKKRLFSKISDFFRKEATIFADGFISKKRINILIFTSTLKFVPFIFVNYSRSKTNRISFFVVSFVTFSQYLIRKTGFNNF